MDKKVDDSPKKYTIAKVSPDIKPYDVQVAELKAVLEAAAKKLGYDNWIINVVSNGDGTASVYID